MANNKDFKVKNGIKPTAYHEAVGTVTSGSTSYDISNISYDNVSFALSSQGTIPTDFTFNNDGTKLFTIDRGQDDVFEYDLSTAYDLSTISYSGNSYYINAQESNPQGIAFNPAGTIMVICGDNGDEINRYSLSVGYDLSSTITHLDTTSVSSQDTLPQGIAFNNDGTKVYIAGNSTDSIYEYDLSTAYDTSSSSLSYNNVSLYGPTTFYTPLGLTFKPDGTKLYVVDGGIDGLIEYDLSTAWDLSTATYSGNSNGFLADLDNAITGAQFNADGSKVYATGDATNTLYQYSASLNTATLDLSTGSVFEITPTSDIQIGLSNPAASGTVSQATLLLDGAVVSLSLSDAVDESKTFSISSQSPNSRDIFFSSDGLKMFTFEDVYLAPYVYAYDLSVAWDVSTASYNGESFDPSANINQLEAGQFSSDGTKLYIVDAGFQDIFQYTLSTAWDLSTASYDSKSFDPSQTTIFDAIAFNYDGTKMYISAASGGVVYQYTLSTAWDISTASYDSKSFDFSTQNSNVRALFFTEDGYSVFSLDYNSHAAYSYTMTTAFDISTASYTGTNYVFSPVNLYGMFVDEGSGKLYIASDSTDTVYQYSIGSPATITYDSTLQFGGGTAPESPAIGETDVLTFSTRDGGTTYQAAIAIDGAA